MNVPLSDIPLELVNGNQKVSITSSQLEFYANNTLVSKLTSSGLFNVVDSNSEYASQNYVNSNTRTEYGNTLFVVSSQTAQNSSAQAGSDLNPYSTLAAAIAAALGSDDGKHKKIIVTSDTFIDEGVINVSGASTVKLTISGESKSTLSNVRCRLTVAASHHVVLENLYLEKETSTAYAIQMGTSSVLDLYNCSGPNSGDNRFDIDGNASTAYQLNVYHSDVGYIQNEATTNDKGGIYAENSILRYINLDDGVTANVYEFRNCRIDNFVGNQVGTFRFYNSNLLDDLPLASGAVTKFVNCSFYSATDNTWKSITGSPSTTPVLTDTLIQTYPAGSTINTWRPNELTLADGNLDMNSNKITNLSDATSATDAMNKQTVEATTLDTFAVPTGNVDMNSNKIVNVTDCTSAQDAATKAYVDGRKVHDLTLATASLDMNSQLITGLATPIGNTDAVTKAYVDGAVSGTTYSSSWGDTMFLVSSESPSNDSATAGSPLNPYSTVQAAVNALTDSAKHYYIVIRNDTDIDEDVTVSGLTSAEITFIGETSSILSLFKVKMDIADSHNVTLKNLYLQKRSSGNTYTIKLGNSCVFYVKECEGSTSGDNNFVIAMNATTTAPNCILFRSDVGKVMYETNTKGNITSILSRIYDLDLSGGEAANVIDMLNTQILGSTGNQDGILRFSDCTFNTDIALDTTCVSKFVKCSFFEPSDNTWKSITGSPTTEPVLTDTVIQTYPSGSTINTMKLNEFTVPDGNVDINSNKIVNVTDPTSNQDVATKAYADTKYANTTTLDSITAPTASVDVNSQKIVNLATPSANTDAATKAYVDSQVSGQTVSDEWGSNMFIVSSETPANTGTTQGNPLYPYTTLEAVIGSSGAMTNEAKTKQVIIKNDTNLDETFTMKDLSSVHLIILGESESVLSKFKIKLAIPANCEVDFKNLYFQKPLSGDTYTLQVDDGCTIKIDNCSGDTSGDNNFIVATNADTTAPQVNIYNSTIGSLQHLTAVKGNYYMEGGELYDLQCDDGEAANVLEFINVCIRGTTGSQDGIQRYYSCIFKDDVALDTTAVTKFVNCSFYDASDNTWKSITGSPSTTPVLTNTLLQTYPAGSTVNTWKVNELSTADGNLDMDSNKIVNVTDPTSAQDAATKAYADTKYANTTTLDSITVATGNVDINSNKLVNVTDPTSAQDASTKAYVDNLINTDVYSAQWGTDLFMVSSETPQNTSATQGSPLYPYTTLAGALGGITNEAKDKVIFIRANTNLSETTTISGLTLPNLIIVGENKSVLSKISVTLDIAASHTVIFKDLYFEKASSSDLYTVQVNNSCLVEFYNCNGNTNDAERFTVKIAATTNSSVVFYKCDVSTFTYAVGGITDVTFHETKLHVFNSDDAHDNAVHNFWNSHIFGINVTAQKGYLRAHSTHFGGNLPLSTGSKARFVNCSFYNFSADTWYSVTGSPTDNPVFVDTAIRTYPTGSIFETLRVDQLTLASDNLDMNTNKIVNVTDPTSAQDAATKAYVDGISAFPLTENGDCDSFKLINLLDPTNAQDASTKAYVDGRKVHDLTLATADLNMNSNKILGVDDPTLAQDAATKAYVDGRKVHDLTLATASLNMNTNTITNVTDPSGDQDAATKAYADTKYANTTTLDSITVATGNVDINSNKLVNVTDPTSAQDAATKAYVDAQTSSEVYSTAYGNTIFYVSSETVQNSSAVAGSPLNPYSTLALALAAVTNEAKHKYIIIRNDTDIDETLTISGLSSVQLHIVGESKSVLSTFRAKITINANHEIILENLYLKRRAADFTLRINDGCTVNVYNCLGDTSGADISTLEIYNSASSGSTVSIYDSTIGSLECSTTADKATFYCKNVVLYNLEAIGDATSTITFNESHLEATTGTFDGIFRFYQTVIKDNIAFDTTAVAKFVGCSFFNATDNTWKSVTQSSGTLPVFIDTVIQTYPSGSTFTTARLHEITAPTDSVDVNSQKITSLAAPTAGTDAVTKTYADGVGFTSIQLDSVAAYADSDSQVIDIQKDTTDLVSMTKPANGQLKFALNLNGTVATSAAGLVYKNTSNVIPFTDDVVGNMKIATGNHTGITFSEDGVSNQEASMFYKGTSLYFKNSTTNTIGNTAAPVIYLQSDGTSWSVSSDLRLKTITEHANSDDSLNLVNNLNVVKFTYNTGNQNKVYIGGIAQDYLNTFWDTVVDVDENGYYSLQYDRLVMLVISATQKLNQKINEQQTTINTQQQQINDLLNRVSILENN